MIAGRKATYTCSRSAIFCALLSAEVMLGGVPARAQNWEKCVEAIAKTQQELKQVMPKTAQPQTQQQSIAAQDSHEPTPGSLAAAGLEPPVSGPEGALNEAQNLQAGGDEAGCMRAVAKARSLAGLK